MKTPQFYAQLYDEVVHDWPDEINFYRQLIEENGISSLLEVACGTGRVMLKLIREGMEVTGVDLDTALLEVARTKANGHPSVTLREGDMQSFHLDRTFQLAIIPGHSFQFMLASEAQLNCITNIERHLIANGLLVVHLDYPEIDWLGDLTRGLGGVFGVEAEVSHPETGALFAHRKRGRMTQAAKLPLPSRDGKNSARTAQRSVKMTVNQPPCIVFSLLKWNICSPGVDLLLSMCMAILLVNHLRRRVSR